MQVLLVHVQRNHQPYMQTVLDFLASEMQDRHRRGGADEWADGDTDL